MFAGALAAWSSRRAQQGWTTGEALIAQFLPESVEQGREAGELGPDRYHLWLMAAPKRWRAGGGGGCGVLL